MLDESKKRGEDVVHRKSPDFWGAFGGFLGPELMIADY